MYEIQDHDDLPLVNVGNELLETFGDKYLVDAMRIVSTRTFNTVDNALLYEALVVVVAIYMQKLQEGEINRDRILH